LLFFLVRRFLQNFEQRFFAVRELIAIENSSVFFTAHSDARAVFALRPQRR
jgi:hypothetical protein